MFVDDSAVGGRDYVANNGTLVFLNGCVRACALRGAAHVRRCVSRESTKSFSVTILDDSEYELQEVFSIELHNPQGGAGVDASVNRIAKVPTMRTCARARALC